MPYTEAKEHAPGRLHTIFADPYTAFDSLQVERHLHLQVALCALILHPMNAGKLRLRIIHGWENGNFAVDDLVRNDHPLASLAAFQAVAKDYQAQRHPPHDNASLLARPLANAIAAAEARGQSLDEETRTTPARWPAFQWGLSLYTFFKVYHRLTYGEDDPYRSIRCRIPNGTCEVHEFHLEEGQFAVVIPADGEAGTHLLLLHDSQLEPMLKLLTGMAEECFI